MFTCDKLFQMILIMVIVLRFVSNQSCPYNEYEQALIPLESQFESNQFDSFVTLDVGESFSFGFWSLCIPQLSLKSITQVEQDFISTDAELGQLQFLVKGRTSNSLLGFVYIDQQTMLVRHKIIILGSKQISLEFDFKPINYQSKWILSYITFNFLEGKIVVDMTDQIRKSGTMNFEQDYVQIIQGGRGYIENFNLGVFKGRLSKIFVNKFDHLGQDLFEYMTINCQIPPLMKDEQTSYLVKGLQIFEGDTSLQYTINQFGSKFCLSGWVKYDISRVIQVSVYPLIRISLFKNYFDKSRIGDEIFLMQIMFNKRKPKFTTISINLDHHKIPIMGNIGWHSNDPIQVIQDIIYDVNSENYFQGLQQWHFLKYEYGSSIPGKKSCIQIKFFNNLNLLEKCRDIIQPTNSPFYVYLGSDEYVNELLKASLFDFKLEFNYVDEKELLFNACHQTCLTCDGPLENNCINCEQNINRYYLNEQKKCQCLQGYMEVQNEKLCQQFEYHFSSVQIQELYILADYQCKFGYFIFQNEKEQSVCIKCPQSNFLDILCVDCIYYPLSWYLKPICKFDLVSKKLTQTDAYKYEKRDIYDYDFYLIDQNGHLFLHSGYQDYCDPDLDSINCFQAKYRHFGQTIFVKCKPNYYQFNGDCIFTNINCLLASSDGNCKKVRDGAYLHNGQYYQCPRTCNTCIYDNDKNNLQCLSCINYYALDDGSCFPCGNFCSICQKYNDKNINKSYLKCFKCLDDSKYFLSFDGINCFQNTIKHCDYAFQAVQNDYQINTLDLYFIPRDDWDNIHTTCGRCEYGYGVILNSQICLRMIDVNCYFSYVQQICDTVIDDTILDILYYVDYYTTPTGEKITYAFDDDWNYICTSIQYCLIGTDYYQTETSQIIQFNKQCLIYIENCATCLIEKTHWINTVYICLECKSGYYADRISGKCYLCPSELNCYNCAQQQKISQDYWKINIRALYQIVINFDNNHPFKLYAQSENKEDCEVICTMCIKGYELVQQKCIKACPESCLECQFINGENQCIRCELEQQGRKLSLSENQCITCPQNCALCRIRSDDEISSINPLFSNYQYLTSTYQCLKCFDDQDYYYDQELGTFIACSNIDTCEKQFIIPINLYCSKQEFTQALNDLQSTYQQNQFKLKNILLEDLTSGNSFKEFETNNFYLSANSKLIKTIIINILSAKPQTCKIYGNATIQSVFSQNIFSTINVELNIEFNQHTVIEFERTITFQNFNKITIQGATFNPLSNNKLKQIIFLSKIPQIIILKSIQYQQLNFVNDQSRLIFNDIKKLDLIDFKIIDLIQNTINTFIYIANTTYDKQITLSSFQIINSILQNQVTLFFNLNKNDMISITDGFIQAHFVNSSLIDTKMTKQFGSLVLSKIEFQVDVLNCLNFLNFQLFKKVKISGIKFHNSFIQISTLIILNNNNQIHDLIIKDCKFSERSYGIVNSDSLQLEYLQIELFNLILQENEYHQTTKLLSFDKYDNVYSKIMIKNILISKNYVSSITPDFKLNTQSSCVIYISIDYILISELNIIRGVGLIDFSIVEAKELKIDSSKITQGDEYKFLGLHQYLDCQLQQVNGEYYLQSLFITSVLNFEIVDMQITYTQSYNSPILYYKSFDKGKQQQLETILMSNIIVESNLLLLSNSNYQTAIIFIDSVQQTNIDLYNITFSGNTLHEYVQNNLQISSLLLNLNSILGVITIINSNFLKNTVYNSTDNLIYIKSQKLVLQNCTFRQNSYFDYQLIQPYLLWGFFESEKVSIEQLNQIFKVKSTSGVAQLLIENLEIQYCNFEQSVGFSGGALQIKAQKNSLITISQSQFKNISTTFSQELGFGGAIHLDSTSAQSLEVTFQQIFIENIAAQEQGGFIYILSDSARVNVSFQYFKIRNVYAKLGSIVYFTFTSISSNQQCINLNQFIIENTNEGFKSYLNKYTQLSKTEEIAIMNKRALFYIDSVRNIIIFNTEIHNLILESVLQTNKAQIVSIQNFKISNSLIINDILSLHPNQYLPNTIQISGLVISNITLELQLKYYNCMQQDDKEYTVYFKCIQNAKNKQAPQNLFSQYIKNKFNYGECLLSSIKQQNGQENNLMIEETGSGLISFLDLTKSSQIKLNNLVFSQINCNVCQNVLLFYSFLKIDDLIMKQYISKLKITNSSCGVYGCFYIKKENSHNNRRALVNEDKYLQSLKLEFFIDNYVCQYNKAQNGTCLFVENVKILIENSFFQFNNATGKGGAMVVKMKQDVLIVNSLIQHNSAQTGGGINLIDQQDMDYLKLGTRIHNNKAEFFGNDRASLPQKLTITLNDESTYFETETIQETQELLVQQVIVPSGKLSKQQYILLPSGQQISLYEQFNKINKTYSPFNQKFRVIALSQDNSVMKNVLNSICDIDSRILNISNLNDDNMFSNNLTNIKNIRFNNQTQDYNLDDLIVNFDNALPSEIVLQLQFRCNSIFIPIYNQQYPYNLIRTHSNYKLRINIKTLSCQYGEIKNNTDYSCIPCNSDQGLFSLNLNSQKCELKDDISTINVQPALLNLKFGYWRPYFQSNIVSYCLNQPENCLGGWEEGDNSCFLGHIGALCEQCDLYNIRGDGYYSVSQKYSCGSCLEKEKNSLIITFVSIWTLISILISVQSTMKAIKEQVRIINIMMLGLAVTQNYNQSAILIKMLTNYLQIISSISTFQLKLPSGLKSTINVVGSPIQTLTYSLDCFLSHIFQFQIQYARMVWQVIMPFLYITFFFFCYLLAVKCKKITFNRSVISTTLIYMYIYLQPSLIGGFVQLVSYREISGYKWIQSNVSYRFDTTYHEKWMIELCLPMLLLLAIIIPLYFYYGLYTNSNKLDNKKVRLQWGYLYNEYTKTAYFWEVIKIAQKELMIIFLTYYDDKLILKATIISLIIGMYLELSLKYKPYNLNNLNKLDYYSTNVCLASIALAIGIHVSEQSDSQEIQIPYIIIISILNLNVLYTLISKILIEYLKEKTSIFDEKFDIFRNSIRKNFPFLNQISCMKRLLTNRRAQRERVAKLYQKLKKFVIPQAREIIALKNTQSQIAIERQTEQNIDFYTLGIGSSNSAKERQQCFLKSVQESTLNFQCLKQKSSRFTPVSQENFILENQEIDFNK
ncbi:unnamed protein product [Paramecium sonneborni]|uniref:Transmembrane protein n=1 Tax=Paramecium sonneborni TaxID=65129 RepID=A0A8S1Q6W7_9CILI|nr:unnamed protein product [Paramecium sonneborni]